MGLFDGILGGVVGAEMATAVSGLIERHGGAAKLAQVLPQAIDKLTPAGVVQPHS